ncbi:hypothetical protein KHA80_08920 [Anaerobacillus sp. HL2]|nr:hypothetical protein KHA80_08920 [Anaerobacillus sp. HL2]
MEKLSIVDIGIPKLAVETISNERFLWTEDDVVRSLPVRSHHHTKEVMVKRLS